MDRNIEPGCKAVTVNCNVIKNNGIIVTVGTFIGEVEGYNGTDYWEIDIPLRDVCSTDVSCIVRECQLLRLDEDLKVDTVKDEIHERETICLSMQ